MHNLEKTVWIYGDDCHKNIQRHVERRVSLSPFSDDRKKEKKIVARAHKHVDTHKHNDAFISRFLFQNFWFEKLKQWEEHRRDDLTVPTAATELQQTWQQQTHTREPVWRRVHYWSVCCFHSSSSRASLVVELRYVCVVKIYASSLLTDSSSFFTVENVCVAQLQRC